MRRQWQLVATGYRTELLKLEHCKGAHMDDGGRLGIPIFRRIAGSVIVLLCYFMALRNIVDVQGAFISLRSPAALFDDVLIGWLALLGAIWVTPWMLWPCLTDRFPTCS